MNHATLTASASTTNRRSSPHLRVNSHNRHKFSLVNRTLRSRVLNYMRGIECGTITLQDGSVNATMGEPAHDGLSADLMIQNPRFYQRVALGGSLGAAESFLDGDWECTDLTSLLRIFARNMESTSSMDGFITSAARQTARIAHWLSRNTKKGSRRNIEAHYDLGDDFFRLFLDPTMMYSSAIFEDPDLTLEEAQIARLDSICRQLQLSPGDHLLEIGTGWGGLAVHAAKNYGCHVTTTTISQNQYAYAANRIRSAGVADCVAVLNRDYRDLTGQYDKIVSIEMIEAVGRSFYDTFFQKCAQLLRPEGQLLLQAIVMPEQRYDNYLRSVDFIQKYIFPGGCLPTVDIMHRSVVRTSHMRMLSLRDFAADYARTLREWRSRFFDRLDDVRALGFDDRFIRMWDYYLCYCEAAFEERSVGVVQTVWGR